MKALGKFRYGNWFIPVDSGLLILLSFGVRYQFAGQRNATLSPRWWLAVTEHSHEPGHVFTPSNALMLATDIVVLDPQMDRLAELVQRHASIGLRMLQDVSRRLGETESRLAAIISADVSSRLADYLLSLPAVTSTQHVLGVVIP